MKTLTAPTPYGYQELRQVHHRYMMLAMFMAITIQMMIIGTYHLTEWLKPIDPPKRIIFIDPTRFLPPPIHSLTAFPTIPYIPAKLSVGVPVPIPDCDVKSDILFAGQVDLDRQADREWGQVGDVSENVELKIKDQDPLPTEYRAIEREPMVIFRAVPEYPDIAKRAGIEGTVIVQVLLNKDGKVKKALLAKTSDEVFIESALAAAQKWVFTPALMQGKPVTVWVSIPFRFRLTMK